MRGLETSDDPLAEELRDSLDRINDRMASYERALIGGHMPPDQFVHVYRSCIENRDYVIREMALHESRALKRDRAPEAPTRTDPGDRIGERRGQMPQRLDREPTPPSELGFLSPADIRAAVRQSQQSARPSSDEQDPATHDQRDRQPDHEPAWWERPAR